VLGYNYPGSQWYSDAYALVTGESAPARPREGWFNRLVGGVF
jgi:outer membrane protein assembly factor BamD